MQETNYKEEEKRGEVRQVESSNEENDPHKSGEGKTSKENDVTEEDSLVLAKTMTIFFKHGRCRAIGVCAVRKLRF